MIEALAGMIVLVGLVSGLVSIARARHVDQAAQTALDAAAWTAATGAPAGGMKGPKVRSLGPWRSAHDAAGRHSRRVPAW